MRTLTMYVKRNAVLNRSKYRNRTFSKKKAISEKMRHTVIHGDSSYQTRVWSTVRTTVANVFVHLGRKNDAPLSSSFAIFVVYIAIIHFNIFLPTSTKKNFSARFTIIKIKMVYLVKPPMEKSRLRH